MSWLDDIAEMSRRAAEAKFGVQDWPMSKPADDTPESFEYEGQLYVTRQLLKHVTSTGDLGHDEQWVVEAIPIQKDAERTFNLSFNFGDGSWKIEPEEET